MGNRGSSWRIVRVFEDRGLSGVKAERSGLDEALAYLCDGDTRVVRKLDRLGRSMTHLLQTAPPRDRKGGRPKAATPNKVAGAHSLIASGLTVREAAARLKIGKSALYAALAGSKDCEAALES